MLLVAIVTSLLMGYRMDWSHVRSKFQREE